MKKRCPYILGVVAVLAVVGLTITPVLSIDSNESITREVNQNDSLAQYQTIRDALSDALPGDIIIVHPGTYEESVTISGATLKALRGPEVTVIQSPDGTGDGVTLTGNQNVSLIGFRIQGFVQGICVNTNGGNTKVANCIVTGNSGYGLFLAELTPVSTKIINNTSSDNGGDGIYAIARNKVFTSIFGNLVFRNGGFGFNASSSGPWAEVVFGDYNCIYGNTKGAVNDWSLTGTHTINTDPLVDVRVHYRFMSQSSPAVNAGHPASFYNDPDGSQNDMGAYGGPEAANWWRDPFTGPTIENVTIDPPQVRPGGTVTIRATAKTE
jgi:hypothetical protein